MENLPKENCCDAWKETEVSSDCIHRVGCLWVGGAELKLEVLAAVMCQWPPLAWWGFRPLIFAVRGCSSIEELGTVV